MTENSSSDIKWSNLGASVQIQSFLLKQGKKVNYLVQ